MKTLSEIILYKQPQMTPSLQKFANWLWSHAESIFNLSMKNCAINAGVSEPTVMRFCKFLSFSGFQDFRIKLQKEFALSQWKPPLNINNNLNNANINKINHKINNKINNKAIIYEQTHQALQELDKTLTDDILNKLVLILSKANNILLIADQTAIPMATIFHQQSYIITDQVIFYPDKIMQHIGINLLERNDAILIFAQNKLPKNILNNINNSLKNGIKIILIAPETAINQNNYNNIINNNLINNNLINNNLIHIKIIWPETHYICVSSSPTIQMALISEIILKSLESALSEKPKRRKIKINKCLNIN